MPDKIGHTPINLSKFNNDAAKTAISNLPATNIWKKEIGKRIFEVKSSENGSYLSVSDSTNKFKFKTPDKKYSDAKDLIHAGVKDVLVALGIKDTAADKVAQDFTLKASTTNQWVGKKFEDRTLVFRVADVLKLRAALGTLATKVIDQEAKGGLPDRFANLNLKDISLDDMSAPGKWKVFTDE